MHEYIMHVRLILPCRLVYIVILLCMLSSPGHPRQHLEGAVSCVSYLALSAPRGPLIAIRSFAVIGSKQVRARTHGYQWISMDIHGYPWISMDIHGHPWISIDIHGFPWISDALISCPVDQQYVCL